jgi:outer membrane lipoprotein-sorting protein
MFTALAKGRNVCAIPDATDIGAHYMRDMNRRTAILAPLALFALGAPAFAARIPLAELSAYLNSLTTVEADFTQVNGDGSIATGRLFIRRPGRIRFEYAPPDRSLVMAGGQQVAIFDAKSNQPPEQYPLRRTPLNLILAADVNLGRAKMVVGHREVENTTRVVAQDPENPAYGTIELVFTGSPVALRQWIITDDVGNKTTVILGEMKKGGSIPASYFDITAETRKRGL